MKFPKVGSAAAIDVAAGTVAAAAADTVAAVTASAAADAAADAVMAHSSQITSTLESLEEAARQQQLSASVQSHRSHASF